MIGANISLRAERARQDGACSDDGLTLVELLVAFTCLIILMTLVGSALTTYLNAGTTVISSYAANDQFLPSQVVIARLIRSEVEPAPTQDTGATANIPVPPFVTNTEATNSNTFYANIGDPNGPAKIVMNESTASTCSGCRFASSIFTVTEYPADSLSGSTPCPFSLNAAATVQCGYQPTDTSAPAPKVLVSIHDIVNGPGLPYSTPIFTYNTLDPFTPLPTPPTYVPGNTSFATCAAPTLDANGNPIASNCTSDNIQSVGVDLEVQLQGSPVQENAFTVYRLSSNSYLYSPIVG